jgi:hypothetical protein
VVHNLLNPLGAGPVPRGELPAAVRDFLTRHQVGVVVIAPASAGWWEGVFDEMGLPKQRVGGVIVYQVE